MYAALGVLDPDTQAALQHALPTCFSEAFSRCWDAGHENDPGCARYADAQRAYAIDPTATQAQVDALPYCRYDQNQLYLYAGIAGAAGLILGVLLS